MRIVEFDALINREDKIEGSVVITIGVFDGLHLGHRKLFSDLMELNHLGESCVISFKQNPASILHPERFLGNILPLKEKLNRMEKLGIECVVLIDFSPNFSKLSGENFLNLLFDNVMIKGGVVGYNFGFGYRRSMDAVKLQGWFDLKGIPIIIQSPVTYRGESVSSSRIRNCIVNGDIEEANFMLKENYSLFLKSEFLGNDEFPMFVYKKGELMCKREGIRQVVPESGGYEVFVHVNNGKLSAQIEIDKNVIKLRNVDSNVKKINKIEFMRRIF